MAVALRPSVVTVACAAVALLSSVPPSAVTAAVAVAAVTRVLAGEPSPPVVDEMS